MRALLGILCLFLGSPDEAASDEFETAGNRRTEEYRAVLSEIAVGKGGAQGGSIHDLPDAVRQAIDAWTNDEADLQA